VLEKRRGGFQDLIWDTGGLTIMIYWKFENEEYMELSYNKEPTDESQMADMHCDEQSRAR
jgi:hypothetical protein